MPSMEEEDEKEEEEEKKEEEGEENSSDGEITISLSRNVCISFIYCSVFSP